MNRTAKYSALAFGLLFAAASQVNASFNYDLRFDPNFAQPTAPSTPYSVVNPTAGTYQLQLWAQITANNSLTAANDEFTSGYVNISSGTAGGGAAFAGPSGTQPNGVAGVFSFSLGSSWVAAQSQIAQANNNTADQVDDWGTSDGSSTGSPALWALYSNASTVAAGSAVAGQSEAGGTQANTTAATWEVLIGTFDVKVSGLNAAGSVDQQTTFTPAFGSGTKFGSGGGRVLALNAKVDGTLVAAGTETVKGVTFDIPAIAVPEPASLGILGLGAMGLLAKRRKA